MVASENRQLWNRLSRLTKTNKSLGNHLHKISNALQQHPPNQQPLETLSYNFKNDFNISKSDSDQLLMITDPGSYNGLNFFNNRLPQSRESQCPYLLNFVFLQAMKTVYHFYRTQRS